MHVLLTMELTVIQKKIFEIRGYRVMLDRDLAELYGVQTKALNLAVKRNSKRFPPDFLIRLTKDEYNSLRFHSETLKRGAHSKYLPYAFTEHGVTMLASVLKSPTAIEVIINIVRAFILLKQNQENYKWLAQAIEELELRTNRKIENLNEAIEFLLSNHDETRTLSKTRRRIGFKP